MLKQLRSNVDAQALEQKRMLRIFVRSANKRKTTRKNMLYVPIKSALQGGGGGGGGGGASNEYHNICFLDKMRNDWKQNTYIKLWLRGI